MIKLKKSIKVYQALMLEQYARWMFKKMVPKDMTNTEFQVALLENWRKNK